MVVVIINNNWIMKLYLKILIAAICVCLAIPGNLYCGKLSLKQNHNEYVYVHTDRELYIAGEYLQYKAYLLNDEDKQDLQSKFVYLAVRSESEVVKRATMVVDGSYTSGSIYLQDTLSTGYYELIAHTNWMRNKGEEAYFRKPLLIVNRFDESPEYLLHDTRDTDDLQLFFIPESGNFLKELDNNLLVKTKGNFDTALREIWILNQYNDTIDTIANSVLNVHGFTTFSIVPDPGYTYYAVIDGVDRTFKLPKARKSGCILKVNEENNKLRIEILSAEESPSVDWVRIKYKDNVVYEERVYEKPFITEVPLDDQGIPEGLLFLEAGGRGWGKVAERIWYNDHAENSEILIETDKEQYDKRDEISLTIDGSGIKDEHALISVSVVKPSSINRQNTDFDGYKRALELTRMLDYNHKEAVSLFGKMDVDELNEYLIIYAAGEDNVDHGKQKFSGDYFIENESLIISGKVIDGKTNDPLKQTRVILNKPDTVINVLYTKTDDMGRFHFALSDYFYDDRIYFFVDAQNDENKPVIQITDKFSYETPFEKGRFALLRDKMDFIKRSQDIVRINKAYGIDYVKEAIKEAEPVAYPPLLFSEANRTIYTDNYASLDSLHEISREIVHGWQLRSRAGKYISRLVCDTERKWLPEAPVYFLDGIITYDVNKLTHLDSEKIHKIQIQNYKWYHGEMFFPGIIGIFTRNYDYLTTLAHRTRTSMIKETLRKPTKYVAPEYDPDTGGVMKQPDLRQVLYWDADIEIGKGQSKTYSFYSGDLSGDYLIKVQGITSGGAPVNITKTIKIN